MSELFHYFIVRLTMFFVITVVGEPQTFQLNVRPASNFPLDVYLLMDLSGSMNDDLDNLKRLGSQLGEYNVISIRSVMSRKKFFLLLCITLILEIIFNAY